MKFTKKESTKTKFNVWVFSNSSADCYTIILGNGDLLCASDAPFHPLGIGQHCGNLVDDKLPNNWRENFHIRISTIVKREVNKHLKEARNNPSWLGAEIREVSLLNKDVQQFIRQNL